MCPFLAVLTEKADFMIRELVLRYLWALARDLSCSALLRSPTLATDQVIGTTTNRTRVNLSCSVLRLLPILAQTWPFPPLYSRQRTSL